MLSSHEKKQLKHEIKSNRHEVFIVSFQEMDAIVSSSAKGTMVHVQSVWAKLKVKAEVGASYYASVDDLRTLGKLVGELGSFGAKAYVKTYGGKPHIILKGHPGLRKVLTGTKYGMQNPKVITMGLGKTGAVHAAKSGGILSVILLSSYRIADYFFADQSTLSQLIGSLSTDIVKVGIATGASIGAASLLVAAGVTLAVGPIIAVVIVGVSVSMALSMIDDYYGITDRVIAGLDEAGGVLNSSSKLAMNKLRNVSNQAVASVVDYVIDVSTQVIINFSRHQLSKFMSSRPRIY